MTDLDPNLQAAIAKVLDSSCQDFLAGGDQESRSYIFARLVEAARKGRDLNHAARNALAVVEGRRMLKEYQAARASP